MKTSQKLKIGFNGSCLTGSHVRGWARYTQCLIDALEKHFSDEAEVFVFKKDNPSRNHSLWEQVDLRQEIIKNKIDIFHAPANGGLPLAATCPTALTIHDLFGEQQSKKQSWSEVLKDFKRFARYKLDWHGSILRANVLITISEFCRKEMIEAGFDSKKIRVIYEAAEESFHPRSVKSPEFLRKPYFIYVGGFEERKNIDTMLSVFSRSKLDANFFLAGKLDSWGEKHKAKFAHDKRISFLGFVDDEKLCEAYSGATAFVIFSHAEGFGLPPVEAMACGCPVLTTQGGALGEIVGTGGFVIDSETFVRAAERLLQDQSAYLKAKDAALQRGTSFSWRKTAGETLAVYREVISK